MREQLTEAKDLYEELRATLALPSVREAYRVYSRVLRIAVDQKTDFDTLHLGSLYAKLDYLTREYHLASAEAHRIHDTRVRLRTLLRLTDEELELCRMVDLSAICQLIARLYEAPIPSDMVALLPTQQRPAKDSTVVAEYMRLYVSRYDDVFVYGTCPELPDTDEVCACYNYTGGYGNGDNRYLKPFLHKGVQLNLIRPSLFNGVYYPELYVLDPDYLVDITTVTTCFEEYAHDARLALLLRLKASDDTEATMLGNLAGQLLDDEVHTGENDRTYVESYADFVRANAFKMLTVRPASLYEDGQNQQDNIHKALHEGLQRRIGRYDPSQVILEPSFVSEMLGLQGRMDFLQLDYGVLIEQKSGKGQWYMGMRDDMPPREQLKHRVQVLLYQAILHYNHRMANRDMQLLLLYSKYEQGLIGVAPAPQLLYEAMKIRNEIAGLEAMACRGGMAKLLSLKPSDLKLLDVNENFWKSYKEPELAAILDPVQKASPLERAYVLRFMTFLANEHTLSKVGNRKKESSGFAAKWNDTLDEKYQTGNIYDQLTLLSPGIDHEGMVTDLTLAFAVDRASEMSNFREGDIVMAYRYPDGQDPDVRSTIVIRGTVAEITTSTLHIVLRAPQSDKRVFYHPLPDGKSWHWAVEHDFFESSYKSQYSGMHAFLKAPRERRELLLLQRHPRVDPSQRLKGSYGSFDELSLRVRQAKDFFLIIGPPGTGKTSYGMLNTVREQLLDEGSQVLVTSFTNRAVDEVCAKLMAEGVDFVRLGNPLSCAAEFRDHVLSNRLAHATSLNDMRQVLDQVRVVVGTTTSLSGSLALFRLKTFDLAIIDEASQILEPQLVGLLSACGSDGEVAIRKFVMIGDHKQLPAVVQQSEELSRVDDPLLRTVGLTDCRLSMFERLLSRYRDDPSVVYMLTHQGRMHRDIADWPNQRFYGGRLHVVPLPHQEARLQKSTEADPDALVHACFGTRIAFVDVPTVEPVIADKVNRAEAEMIGRMVVEIYRHEQERGETFDALQTVGVIVPYRNQIAAVRSAIEARGKMQGMDETCLDVLRNITIDTVERYQGSQRDYIIYGFTVQRPYQLNFLTNNTFDEDGVTIDRKLNVAMTRARKHLVMLGSASLLKRVPLFADLIDYVQNKE